MTTTSKVLPARHEVDSGKVPFDRPNGKQAVIDQTVPEPQGNELKRLARCLRAAVERTFTGYIRIGFTQGRLGRIEKFEEILRK